MRFHSMICVATFVVLFVHGVCIGAEDGVTAVEEPRTPAALNAKANYLKQMKQLQDEVEAKQKKIINDYAAALDNLRKEALEANDLDEAQRTLTFKKVVESGEFDPAVLPRSPRGFQVIQAMWGAADKWMDVTPAVKKSVRNGSLMIAENYWEQFPDVNVGHVKTGVIVYSIDGKVQLATIEGGKRAEIPTPKKK